MGYYAEFTGCITLKPMTPEDEKNLIAKYNEVYQEKASFIEDFYGWGGDRDVLIVSKTDTTVQYEIDVYGDEKYYETEVRAFLEVLAPYTNGGKIEFREPDNSLWRMVFREGHWDEEYGQVIYHPIAPKDFSTEELLHELFSRCSEKLRKRFAGKIYRRSEKKC